MRWDCWQALQSAALCGTSVSCQPCCTYPVRTLYKTNHVASDSEGSSPYTHQSLSWATWIHSTTPQPISPRSIVIPSPYLRLGLASGIFPSGFPTKTLYTFLFSPMRATCPAYLILFYIICLIISEGAHPASCTMGTGGPFPGGKARPERDADHSPPSSAEVVNE
jgi:hypothetical protein